MAKTWKKLESDCLYRNFSGERKVGPNNTPTEAEQTAISKFVSLVLTSKRIVIDWDKGYLTVK